MGHCLHFLKMQVFPLILLKDVAPESSMPVPSCLVCLVAGVHPLILGQQPPREGPEPPPPLFFPQKLWVLPRIIMTNKLILDRLKVPCGIIPQHQCSGICWCLHMRSLYHDYDLNPCNHTYGLSSDPLPIPSVPIGTSTPEPPTPN